MVATSEQNAFSTQKKISEGPARRKHGWRRRPGCMKIEAKAA